MTVLFQLPAPILFPSDEKRTEEAYFVGIPFYLTKIKRKERKKGRKERRKGKEKEKRGEEKREENVIKRREKKMAGKKISHLQNVLEGSFPIGH